ncbi:MAG TPA: PAS domain S-box protein [Bdellovibrionota bacterium]|nr:PAS domain S-box protein [Bdellovibrionota bacterium]
MEKTPFPLDNHDMLFKSAFQHSSIGMALVSTEGRWLKVNESLCRMLGYSEEEFHEMTFQAITHPEDLDRDLEHVNQMICGKRASYQMEKRYFHKSGRIVWATLSVSLIREQNGNPEFFISQLQDITELKAAQILIETERAQRAHVARLSALGQLAASIAHEINNPLTILLGQADVLVRASEKPTLDPQLIDRCAHTIHSTVKRIALVIRGLRNSTRDGRNDEFEEFPLTEMLQDVLSLCKQRYLKHNIEIRLPEISPKTTLYGQKIQLEQVLVNIFNNAFDAVKDLKVKWVSLEFRQNDTHAIIEITDSGEGISPEIRRHLMLPFFTTKKAEEGTGIGLSISKAIVEQHGGDFYLDETSPHTCFVISLPRRFRPNRRPEF